jgi:hypothetical protein
MPLTVYLTHILREVEVDAFGAGGRTTTHRVATLQADGVSRTDSKLWILSAGLSNQEVNLSPLAASQPGNLIWLQTDQPLDVRLNSSNATLICAVHQMVLATVLSALYLTTVDSGLTTLRLAAWGGGSISVNEPSP